MPDAEATESDNNNNDKNYPIPHTFGVYDHVTEVEYVPSYDNNDKSYPIPHTFGVYDRVTEVESLPAAGQDNNSTNGATPHTFGAYDHVTEVEHTSNYDKYDKSGAVPHTFGAYKQVTEVEDESRAAHGVSNGGFIRLLGDDSPRGVLTQAQRASYDKNGYIILPDAVPDSQGTELLEEARNVMQRIFTGGEGIIRHDVSSGSGVKQRPSPIGRVLATFEPEDRSSPNPFERRVARLGLGVHQKLPTFRYTDPRITQSQLIAKLAGIGSHLVPHQDGCASFTDPPSAVTFWYALEDATMKNGCLCVAPGSHLTTPLRQRLIKLDDGMPRFVDLETPLWAPGADGDTANGDVSGPQDDEYKALEVKKGSLILFHGNLMHKSGANKSEKNRMAYTFSIIDGRAQCPDDSYVRPVAGTFETSDTESSLEATVTPAPGTQCPPCQIFASAGGEFLSRVYWYNSTLGLTLDTISVIVTQYNHTAVTERSTVHGDFSTLKPLAITEVQDLQHSLENQQYPGQPSIILINGTGGDVVINPSIQSPVPYLAIAGYISFSDATSDPGCLAGQIRDDRSTCGCVMTSLLADQIAMDARSMTTVDLEETFYSIITTNSENNLEDELSWNMRDMDVASYSEWLLSVDPARSALTSCFFMPAFIGPPAMKVPVSALTATVITTIHGTDRHSWTTATPALTASHEVPAKTSMATSEKENEPSVAPLSAPGWDHLSGTRASDAVEDSQTRTLASPPSEIDSGHSTYTLGPSLGYLIASKVLKEGEDPKTFEAPISIPVGGASILVDGAIVVSGTSSQSSPGQSLIATPILSVLGSTYTMDKSSNFIVQGQMVTPGGAITVSGSVISVPPVAVTDSESFPAQTVLRTPVVSILGSAFTMDMSSNFVVDGQTVRPGGAITVSGTAVSMPSGSSLFVVGGITQTLSQAIVTADDQYSEGTSSMSGSIPNSVLHSGTLSAITSSTTLISDAAEETNNAKGDMMTVASPGAESASGNPTTSETAGTLAGPADADEVQSRASASKTRSILWVVFGVSVGLGLLPPTI
ncbi:MAG: hypothetical protein Q9171_006341 [Xanthocarpia ochracea]